MSRGTYQVLGIGVCLLAAIGCTGGAPGGGGRLPVSGGDDGTADAELGEAEVVYPAYGGAILVVNEKAGPGSVTYRGTIADDGAVALTNFEADAGDSWFTVSFDASGLPMEVAHGAARVLITPGGDGAFGFEVFDGDTQVYAGADVMPESAAAKIATVSQRVWTSEDMHSCAASGIEENLERMLDAENDGEELAACAGKDPMLISQALVLCVTHKLLIPRIEQIIAERELECQSRVLVEECIEDEVQPFRGVLGRLKQYRGFVASIFRTILVDYYVAYYREHERCPGEDEDADPAEDDAAVDDGESSGAGDLEGCWDVTLAHSGWSTEETEFEGFVYEIDPAGNLAKLWVKVRFVEDSSLMTVEYVRFLEANVGLIGSEVSDPFQRITFDGTIAELSFSFRTDDGTTLTTLDILDAVVSGDTFNSESVLGYEEEQSGTDAAELDVEFDAPAHGVRLSTCPQDPNSSKDDVLTQDEEPEIEACGEGTAMILPFTLLGFGIMRWRRV